MKISQFNFKHNGERVTRVWKEGQVSRELEGCLCVECVLTGNYHCFAKDELSAWQVATSWIQAGMPRKGVKIDGIGVWRKEQDK